MRIDRLGLRSEYVFDFDSREDADWIDYKVTFDVRGKRMFKLIAVAPELEDDPDFDLNEYLVESGRKAEAAMEERFATQP